MKVAGWLGAGALLLIVLIIAMQSGDRRGDGAGPSVGSSAEAPEPAVGAESSRDLKDGDEQNGDAQAVLWEPDREVNASSEADAGESPRTIFGTVPVEKLIELPIIDPSSLPYDKDIGRVEIDVSTRPDETAMAAAGHPMFTPSEQTGIADDDGPLGGVIPQPEPGATGPADIPVAGSTSVPTATSNDPIADPFGPGQPIDPADAEATPPMYVLPGDETTIEDPDQSP